LPLLNKTDVKDYLDIVDTDYDNFIDDCILEVESEILNKLGQEVESTSADVILIGNGKEQALLVNHPVTLINSLSYKAIPTDDWTTIDSSEYQLFKTDTCDFIYYSTFIKGYQYKVNITYGYATVPDAIKGVAVEMTTDKLLNSRNTPINDDFRHGISQRAETVNGFTGTTTMKQADYMHRLGKYQVIL
jgi:hypothetical protein